MADIAFARPPRVLHLLEFFPQFFYLHTAPLYHFFNAVALRRFRMKFASAAFLCYTPLANDFSAQEDKMKRRRDRKKFMVRVMAIVMAALLVLGTMYSLLYYIFW